MTKLVLASDGSEYSQAAARYLVDNHVLHQDADVDIVSVSTRLPPHVTRFVSEEDQQTWYAEENSKAITPIEQILSAGGVRFTPVSLYGTPEEAIVDHANQVGAKLIVIGTHGNGAFMNAVMGSVASKVVSRSTIPVLLIKKPG